MKLSIKDFNLPKHLEKYRLAVRELVKTELDPIAEEMERTGNMPKRLIPLLKEAGLLSLRIPKEYGGKGLTFSQYWPILEEIAKSHGTTRMLVHTFNGTWAMIHHHGTEAQKKKYIPMQVEGKGFLAFALTEPGTGTGVDIKTTAKKIGNSYVINGTKHLISFADIACVFHVALYTGDRSLGAKATSMLLVEPGTSGFTIKPHREMMGNRACYHAILEFKDCKVPVKNLLGKEGEGLDIALRTFLDLSRLSIAVSCLGGAQRMLELSTDYARKRVTFGKPIAERQIVQQMLADIGTDVYALRCMIDASARKYDAGEPVGVESSMCKLFGIETTRKVSDLALNIHGGMGTEKSFKIEQLYRDMRELWFEEGTPSVQRLVIGRDILGKDIRRIGK